ncbi:MAG: hypothetical protein ACYTEK_09010 [Planctomycetota bacterium]
MVLQNAADSAGKAISGADHCRYKCHLPFGCKTEQRLRVIGVRPAGSYDPIITCLLAQGYQPGLRPP